MKRSAVPATGSVSQQARRTTAPARARWLDQQRDASIHAAKSVNQMLARWSARRTTGRLRWVRRTAAATVGAKRE
jgi:hypothetical protein